MANPAWFTHEIEGLPEGFLPLWVEGKRHNVIKAEEEAGFLVPPSESTASKYRSCAKCFFSLSKEITQLRLGWLFLIGNRSALFLYSKVLNINSSFFRFNVPGISHNFCFPTLMILQLMDCETMVQGRTQEMSAMEITYYGPASPAHWGLAPHLPST